MSNAGSSPAPTTNQSIYFMRKLRAFFTIISVLVVSLVSFDSFAQDEIDETTQTVVIDTDNEEMVALLRDMATELGTTTEYLFDVTVRQAHVAATKSMINIVVVLVIGVMLIFLTAFFVRKFQKDIQDYADRHQDGKLDGEDRRSISNSKLFKWLLSLVIGFISFSIAINELGTVIDGFVNPEYWALNDILDAISGGE